MELVTSLECLRESFMQLRLTVAEDHPPRDSVVLVDQLENAVDDNLGWQEEAIAAALEARAAEEVEALRTCLKVSNSAYLRSARQFRDELTSHRRVAQLMQFGKRRGGEWKAWTKGVKAALEQQYQPLDQVQDSFMACWLELSSGAGWHPARDWQSRQLSGRFANVGPIANRPQVNNLPHSRQEHFSMGAKEYE